MKKAWAWLLLVALALPGCVAAQEEPHLLWDIPFGSSIAECRRLAQENAGVELEELYDDNVGRMLQLAPGQTAKVWGRPVAWLEFHFTDHRLSFAKVEFLRKRSWGMEKVSEEDFRDRGSALWTEIRFHTTLLDDVAYEYDTQLAGGELLVEYANSYDYPLQDGAVHDALLMDLALEGKQYYLISRFGNVTTFMDVDQGFEGVESRYVKHQMWFSDTPWEPMTLEGKDGAYPYEPPARSMNSPMHTMGPAATAEPAA